MSRAAPSSLVRPTLVLAAGNLLTRALGLAYRLLLTRWLGGEALGLFQLALSVYFALAQPFVSSLPAALAHTLAVAKVQHFPAVPAMVRALASLPDLPPWPALRVCLTAGAPLTPRDAAAFFAATGHKPHVFYGSSECGGITYDRTDACPHQEGAVGTPLDGVRVDVVDEEGNPLPAGTEGRVRVRSRAVTVAVRARSSSSAISPKNSPGPISRMRCPSRLTSTFPSTMRKNPIPGSPCLTITAPGS